MPIVYFHSQWQGVLLLLLDGPGLVGQERDVADVAPVAHGGAEEGGGQVVEADEHALDPREEEDDDLPAARLAHRLQQVLEAHAPRLLQRRQARR